MDITREELASHLLSCVARPVHGMTYDQLLMSGHLQGEGFRAALASPEIEDAQKQNLLGLALDHWSRNILDMRQGARQVVVELLEAGANPLRTIPDLAGGRPKIEPLHDLIRSHPDIALHLVNMLATLKQDHDLDCLDEEGCNVLHVLCENQQAWTGNALDSALHNVRMVMPHPKQTMSLPQRVSLHKSWVNQTNAGGETPLHTLWRDAIYSLLDSDDERAFAAWDISEYLRQLGGSLLARDNQEITPAALMLQATGYGLKVPSNVNVDRIRADHEADQLGRQSPSSSLPPARRSL